MPELRGDGPRGRLSVVRSHAETDLLILGAGAKGAAIAMKAHVLNSLGLGPISLTVVEAVGPAAAWRDGEGVTSSREILGLGPCKDIGFPYQGARPGHNLESNVDLVLRFVVGIQCAHLTSVGFVHLPWRAARSVFRRQ